MIQRSKAWYHSEHSQFLKNNDTLVHASNIIGALGRLAPGGAPFHFGVWSDPSPLPTPQDPSSDMQQATSGTTDRFGAQGPLFPWSLL